MWSNKKPYPKDTFDSKYKPSFRICKKILDKAFDIHDSAGKFSEFQYNIYNYYTPWNTC